MLALLCAVDREIAGGIAQAFLLLVSGIVLLVDDDQRQFRQRRQNREPRPEHDARASRVRGEPVAHALAFGEAAVHRDDRAFGQRGETRAERGLELRRQIDFGHEDERLRVRPRVEQARERVQIDLGLAAARHAVQQERREAARGGDRIDGFLLFLREAREQGVIGECLGQTRTRRLRPSSSTTQPFDCHSSSVALAFGCSARASAAASVGCAASASARRRSACARAGSASGNAARPAGNRR